MKDVRYTIILTIFMVFTIMLFAPHKADARFNFGQLTAPLTSSATQAGFPIILSGNSHIRYAPVALGDLNNNDIDDIVVGDSEGNIHAYDGFGNRLWVFDTGEMAIEGKAAIGDINQDGWSEVVVGAGSPFTASEHGGLYVIGHNGNLICSFNTGDFNNDGWRDGVYSTPTLVDFDKNDSGKLEIIFGSWDGYVRVLNDNCSLVWQKFMRDTIWSSPAVGDIDRDGSLDIVIGVDSHAEPDLQPPIYKGGRLEVLDRLGNPLPGFPKHTDEVIFSSPALGDIDGDGWLEIFVGTGNYWGDPACGHPDGCTPGVGHYVNGWDHNGNPLPNWPRPTGDYVWASPALADLDGDGALEVIVNSADSKLYAWNGDGSNVPGWPVTPVTPGCVSFATNASPVVADLDGNGSLEVLLPSNWEIVVWNSTGTQLSRDCSYTGLDLSTDYTVNSVPAVGDLDGDDDIEVLVGGAANSSGFPGAIYAWDFSGTTIDENLPWSSFRRDPTNCARHPIPPILSVKPTSLFLLHEAGSSANPNIAAGINNLGDYDFSWSVTTSDPRVTVSPANGYINSNGTIVQITVSAGGLAKGTYSYSATFTGLNSSESVIDSPETLSITLNVVDKVYKSYLPNIIR